MTVFTAVHVVGMAIYGTVIGRTFTWVYVPVLLASIAAVVIIDRRAGPLPTVDLWLLSMWAFAHMLGGIAGDPSGRREILYNWWIVDGALKFDHVVHAYGIAVATMVVTHAAANRGSRRPLVRGFVWGQVIGAGNEVVENVFAALVESSNVGDAVNTAWDMFFHLVGGLIAVAVFRRARRPAA